MEIEHTETLISLSFEIASAVQPELTTVTIVSFD